MRPREGVDAACSPGTIQPALVSPRFVHGCADSLADGFRHWILRFRRETTGLARGWFARCITGSTDAGATCASSTQALVQALGTGSKVRHTSVRANSVGRRTLGYSDAGPPTMHDVRVTVASLTGRVARAMP
ncbi:MAG: hypothetical protein ACI9MC_001751 [Kiritimatiellia bacterium]